jgi:ketosteroid isomerase-like protein
MHTLLSFLTLGLVSLGALACSSENAGAPPPAPVDWHAFDVPHGPVAVLPGPTLRERAVAEAYVTVLSSADLGTLTPHLADDSRFVFPGLNDARGKTAVVQAHQTLFGAFEKRAMAITRLWRTDSVQALEWTMSGVQTRDFMGLAPTNKPVTFRGLTVLYTKDDGTITELHAYFDVAVVKAQLGVGPKELLALAPAAPTGGAPQEFESTHSPDEARNVAAGRAMLDALEKNDDAAFTATMTDDVVVETLERPQPMHGREEMKAYFKGLHRTIAQLDTTVDNSLGAGRFAVVEYFIAGEQIAPMGWIPAQRDKVIRMQVVDVMEIRDGKVAHVWRYDNPSQITVPGL